MAGEWTCIITERLHTTWDSECSTIENRIMKLLFWSIFQNLEKHNYQKQSKYDYEQNLKSLFKLLACVRQAKSLTRISDFFLMDCIFIARSKTRYNRPWLTIMMIRIVRLHWRLHWIELSLADDWFYGGSEGCSDYIKPLLFPLVTDGVDWCQRFHSFLHGDLTHTMAHSCAKFHGELMHTTVQCSRVAQNGFWRHAPYWLFSFGNVTDAIDGHNVRGATQIWTHLSIVWLNGCRPSPPCGIDFLLIQPVTSHRRLTCGRACAVVPIGARGRAPSGTNARQ